MIEKVTAELLELRLDVAYANQGKLRLGLVLTVATVAVTASGWPPLDAVQRAMYYVLVAVPCTGIGLGLMVDELMRSRWHRRGELRADDREVRAIRARIQEDAAARLGTARPADLTRSTTPQRAPLGESARRPPSPPAGRLVRRGRARAPFRTGFLGLR